MEILKINKFSFTYPMNEKKSLDNINLDIKEGEFITICGRSGCGKSTLLKHIKNVLAPSGKCEGEIIYKGKDINILDTREQAEEIGYVFQNPDNQIVTDKVWHELAFGLESLGYDKEVIRLRVAEMASYFGIEKWFYKNVTELSGGEKQLLNLASVMALQPKILLLDEPTSMLDPIAATDFLETIKKINNDIGTTIIIVEHRLEEIFSMSDKIVVMEEGKIITKGEPKEVGTYLKNTKNSMFEALPAALQVYSEIDTNYNCPSSVKEGRAMLNDYFKDRVIEVFEKKIKSEKLCRETIIDFKDVWFKYEKNSDDILKDLSFSIYKGEIHGILGGNGTGKTTTLNLINRINKHYRGVIKIDGTKIEKIPPEKLYYSNMVTLPQNVQSLFVKKTVKEDLAEILKNRGISKDKIDNKIQEMVEFLELNNLLESHPYDLSGGEQQRVALGKILLLDPKIVLLDEPTKGIDNFFKIKLGKYLLKLKEKGITIVIVSHDIEFCAKYCDRCSMLFNGSIITTNEARRFFSGNSFYTTAANRMARHIFKNVITSEDVIELCRMNS